MPTINRVQLALNVTDLDASIAFYRALFDVGPAKVRAGYANFAIADPPLKLVLIEAPEGGSVNHLGVEVSSSGAVATASQRLAATGLDTDDRTSETCCYATQDKVWVAGPDRERWEVYTVLGDAEQMASDAGAGLSEAGPTTPPASAASVANCCT